MSNFVQVAQDFVNFYYQTFDTNRSQLQSLYGPNSMLTFEGQQFQGATAITEKLVELNFTKVQHKVTTFDAQPSVSDGSIIISVIGLLLVDEESHAMAFSQTFLLVPNGGSFTVHNDVFRLNLS